MPPSSAPPPPPGPSADGPAERDERPNRTVDPATEPATEPATFHFRAWNLLLLVPLISLVTPLFNVSEPHLGGLPFFYWFQMAVIPIGIACTLTVHLLTRHADEEGAR